MSDFDPYKLINMQIQQGILASHNLLNTSVKEIAEVAKKEAEQAQADAIAARKEARRSIVISIISVAIGAAGVVVAVIALFR